MGTEDKKYEFPTCLHYLSAALHMEAVDPSKVTVSMPREDWWRLYNALDRRMIGFLKFDGRGSTPVEFKYMGFRFVGTDTVTQWDTQDEAST